MSSFIQAVNGAQTLLITIACIIYIVPLFPISEITEESIACKVFQIIPVTILIPVQLFSIIFHNTIILGFYEWIVIPWTMISATHQKMSKFIQEIRELVEFSIQAREGSVLALAEEGVIGRE